MVGEISCYFRVQLLTSYIIFMRKLLFCALTVYSVIALISCKSKEKTPDKPAKLQSENRQSVQKHCLDKANEQCAEFNITYPVFTGGDSTTTQALNQSVEGYLRSVVGGNPDLQFKQTLDSAGQAFIQMFLDDRKENPDMIAGYATEITHKVTLLNDKVVTLDMDGYSFTGGAHPNPFSMIVSFDLSKKGKPLEITDLVSDTNAVRPILEKAYKVSKGLKETDPLTDVAFEEIKQMPMPGNIGVSAEGIRFFYNVYEIAAYAVGEGDVLLTWEQLGPLADRKKWVE